MSDYIPSKKKFKSSFDILPNEILLHIFDHLTSNDIIYSFFYYNQRLQNLLLTQKYHFEIPAKNLTFWKEILPIIGSQIQTLILNIDYLTVSLDLFSNLTSIIISSPYSLLDGQLKSILNHQSFQQLHTFKIKEACLSNQSYDKNILDDEELLLKNIFDDNNKLQVFQYLPQLTTLSYRNLDQLNSNIHICSLTLNLIDFEDIFILIKNTPNLIYLNIQSQTSYKKSKECSWKNINEMKLEKFYLKLKPRTMTGYSISLLMANLVELFRFIQLFSSSLITLSLDFTDICLIDSSSVVFNGIKLETELLKPMKKLQNFYIYARIGECKDVEQILSTFKRFPWPIGVHENRYLYSLPFPFHELKKFRNFQCVLSNNDEILKHHHRLWSKVRSLELIFIDQIDLKNLLPLIKLNMPKLSSITFFDKTRYNSYNRNDSDDSYDEIERINVELNSVKTICLVGVSIKKFQQILIYSFPNLECLRLHCTELPSKENQLTSFFNQKIQRMEMNQFSIGGNFTGNKDFNYPSNLQHLKLICGLTLDDKQLNNRPQMMSYLLTKLPKLETLSIYARLYNGSIVIKPETILCAILKGLDENEIRAQYKIKYSGDYMWFIKNTVNSF